MPFVLLAALIGLPLLEIAVFIAVGDVIGLWPTLLTVIGTAILGTMLLRRQGLSTLRRARAELDAGRPPVKELFDGICLLVGGVLLLTPGFITDAVGFALLLPPVRAMLGQWAWQVLARRGHVRFATTHDPRSDATVVDIDDYTVEPDAAAPERQVPKPQPDKRR